MGAHEVISDLAVTQAAEEANYPSGTGDADHLLPLFCPLVGASSVFQDGRLFIQLEDAEAGKPKNYIQAVEAASDKFDVLCRGCVNKDTENPHPDAMLTAARIRGRKTRTYTPAMVLFERKINLQEVLASEQAAEDARFDHPPEVQEDQIKYVLYEHPVVDTEDEFLPPTKPRTNIVKKIIRKILRRHG